MSRDDRIESFLRMAERHLDGPDLMSAYDLAVKIYWKKGKKKEAHRLLEMPKNTHKKTLIKYLLFTRNAPRELDERTLEKLDTGRYELFARGDTCTVHNREGKKLDFKRKRTLFVLLQLFLRSHSGHLDREKIARDVWKIKNYNPMVHDNSVFVGINHLRKLLKKLIPSKDPILSISGKSAYVFNRDIRYALLDLAESHAHRAHVQDLTPRQKKILHELEKNTTLTCEQLSQLNNCSKRTIERDLHVLIEANLADRELRGPKTIYRIR